MPNLALLVVKVIYKKVYLQKLPKKSQHVCPTARRCSLRLLVCIVFTLEITVAQFHWNWVFIRSFKTCPRTEGGQNSNYEGEISKVLLLLHINEEKEILLSEKKSATTLTDVHPQKLQSDKTHNKQLPEGSNNWNEVPISSLLILFPTFFYFFLVKGISMMGKKMW